MIFRFVCCFVVLCALQSPAFAERVVDLTVQGIREDILSMSEVCLNGPFDPAKVESECTWKETQWAQESFGYVEGPVWVRFHVRNRTTPTHWLLISEYPWIDHVDLFEHRDGNLRLVEESGDSVSVTRASVPAKQPTFALELPSNQERVYSVRFVGNAEIYIGLTLEDNLTFGTRSFSLRDLFVVFVGMSLLVFVANSFVWFRLRAPLSLYYCLFNVSSLAYGCLLDGSFLRMALKTTRFSDDQLHFGIGLFAAGSILLLWTRLIPMSDLFPRLNKFSRWYAIANCAAGLLTVIGVFPHLVVDVLARILMMYSNLLFYPTAIIAYRRGFRPALYPIFGMPVFSVFMFCYLMSGVVFSGNLIWKNSVWYAYLVEYSVFFASMVSRIRFETSGQMETFRESLARKSRLTGLDIEQLRLRLEEQLSQGVYEDETLSIAKLALLLKIRPDQLSELINVLYGMGFRRLINSRRVVKAQELLETQLDRTVLAIALDTGFGTKAAFNREFKLQTGLTPTEYRRRNSTLRRP